MKKGYPETHSTFTYTMLCGSSVKVGRTTNVPLRLRQIQCMNPTPVSLLGVVERDIERSVHQKLEEKNVTRIVGEWFEFSDTAREVLAAEGLVSPVGGFAAWLLTQAFRDDPIGDFARDTQRDRDWPPSEQSEERIRDYLAYKRACGDAVDAFARAWAEWTAG